MCVLWAVRARARVCVCTRQFEDEVAAILPPLCVCVCVCRPVPDPQCVCIHTHTHTHTCVHTRAHTGTPQSVADSLNIDEVERRNEERLARLETLESGPLEEATPRPPMDDALVASSRWAVPVDVA